jgi:hypothetical protein
MHSKIKSPAATVGIPVYTIGMRRIGTRVRMDASTESDLRDGLEDGCHFAWTLNEAQGDLKAVLANHQLFARMPDTTVRMLLEAGRTAPRTAADFPEWHRRLMLFWFEADHGLDRRFSSTLAARLDLMDRLKVDQLGDALAQLWTGRPMVRTKSSNTRVVHVWARATNDIGDDESGAQDFDTEDSGVQGIYEVLVPAGLSDAHAASCALGGFHNTIAIKNMDGFDITVKDPVAQTVLECDEDIDWGELADLCERVSLLDRLENKDWCTALLPFPRTQ